MFFIVLVVYIFGILWCFVYLLICFFLVVLTTAFDFLASSTFAFFICAFAVFTEAVFVAVGFSLSAGSFCGALTSRPFFLALGLDRSKLFAFALVFFVVAEVFLVVLEAAEFSPAFLEMLVEDFPLVFLKVLVLASIFALLDALAVGVSVSMFLEVSVVVLV